MIISADKKKSLLESMKNNSVMAEDSTSRLKVCIYGANGVGKTVAAVALGRKLIGPDMTIVFVDTNEGWLSLKNHPALRKNVRLVEYESIEQLYVLAEMIYHKTAPYDNVGAIIFDDADFMAARDLNYLWHDRVENQPQSKLDPDKPERPEYLKLGFRFNEVLEYVYKQTPNVHFIMTAHSKEKMSKDGTVVLGIVPGFSPALANEIVGKLLVLGHMTAKIARGGDKDVAKYTREIQVHPTAMIDAKTRIGCPNVKYEIGSFIKHAVEWAHSGSPEEDERSALRLEIATAKIVTEDDEAVIGLYESADEDTPAFVE